MHLYVLPLLLSLLYLHNFWHVIPQLLLSSYILLTSVYLLVSAALNTVTKYSLLGIPDLCYAEIIESIFVLCELTFSLTTVHVHPILQLMIKLNAVCWYAHGTVSFL